MKDRYSGLDPALAEHAKKYQEAQEKFAANGAALLNLGNPTTRAAFIAMRADFQPDPWQRTIDRLNANLPGASR